MRFPAMEAGAHRQGASTRVDARLDPQDAPPAYRPHSNGDGPAVHEARHLSPPDWPVGTHRRREREDWASHLWAMLRTGPLLALVAAAMVAAILGLSGEWFTLRGPTVWTSRTVMLVDEPSGIAVAGDQGLLLKLESVRLKYQGLAATNAIDQPVATKLDVPVSLVEGSAAVVLPADSLLLDVYGQWSSPTFARELSGAVAGEITAFVQQEDTQYKVPAADQFTITVVDAAAPATPSGPSHSKAATVALGLAIAGFVIGFVITQLVRNRR
ncbi:MAG TPA: hypothetical protein VMF60_08715, partial [Acidimicrobiales bacterium]|nr:hypothetical protein [Acidimicrobiales bacterium]